MPRTKKSAAKIFVLDTSVILYNHNAIYSFEDNDVALPISVLEELDNFKKGNDNKNFEAREFIRIMDKLSGIGTEPLRKLRRNQLRHDGVSIPSVKVGLHSC